MNFLFRKIDISSLVFFRIIFGILGFADILGNWIGKHWIERSFNSANFQFKYYGFHWVATLPEPWLSAVFIVGMIAGLGIAFGKWYRWSALIFALVYSYIYFLEKSYYLNHGYLTMVISWWIIFMPLARHYSLDALASLRPPAGRVPYWPLFFFQLSMGIVYFFGGIAKINSDWLLRAQPMQLWLGAKSDMPLLGWIYGQEWVAYFMSWSGMLLDLLVVFFLINKRTRMYALFFVFFFHLNNLILFKIGIFPFLSVTLTLLYWPPDFPKKIWAWLEARAKVYRRIGQWWRKTFTPITKKTSDVEALSTSVQYEDWQRNLIKSAFIVYIGIMLFLPFRHHLIPGEVAWTEEGHRYSWRMMLRQKQAYGSFTVKNLSNNQTERINIRDHLTKRQRRKMLTHPEMILQFAHYLRDKYAAIYDSEVAVYANIRAKLNGRKYQQYILPEVDLAQEEWHWWNHKEWIVPLKS